MKKLTIMFLMLMCFAVNFIACENSKTITISAENNVNTIFIGETLQLKAETSPKDDEASFNWEIVSGNAKISVEGLLTADNAGTVKVKASLASDASISNTIDIVVKDALSLTQSVNLTDVSITYGDTLTNDDLTGGVVKYEDETVDGAYALKQDNVVLVVGEHNVEVVFTPMKSKYKPLNTTLKVVVAPRDITVKAVNGSIEWGEQESGLSYQIITGSLVGGDSPTGALARAAGSNVGEYAIDIGTLSFSDNYNVKFIPGTFTILKAEADITVENLEVNYNGEMQLPTITVRQDEAYVIKSGDIVVEGFKNAGRYAFKIIIETENISGVYEGTFIINKLSVTATLQNPVQQYNGTDTSAKIVFNPAVNDFIITYKNSFYNSTTAPISADKYKVIISQEVENYALDYNEFDYEITANGKFSDKIELYSRAELKNVEYNIQSVSGAINKIVVAGKELANEDYTVADNKLTLKPTAFSTSVDNSCIVCIYTNTQLLVADVNIVDYIITETNWKDFLTNEGENSLKNDTPLLSKSFILTTDIVYGETDCFLGIGKTTLTGSKAFKGVFDGNGHKIVNWSARSVISGGAISDEIQGGNSGFAGLLQGGVIKNLGFENLSVKIHATKVGHYFAGGIAGAIAGGIIENCYINGATIEAYSSNTNLTADNSAVGIIFATTGNAAKDSPSTIKNVIVYGNIRLVAPQAKNIKGIGTVSATNGRFIVVSDTYIAGTITAFTKDSETALEGNPLLINPNDKNAVLINNSYYEKTQINVDKDNALYANFDSKIWNFVEGQAPTLKNQYIC